MTSNNKDRKMTRAKADELLGKVRKNIIECNKQPHLVFCVKRAVVFGSYVNNPEAEKISDLDIGLDFGYRYEDSKVREHCFEGIFDFISLGWSEDRIARVRNSYDVLGMYLAVDEAIFSKEILEIPVGEIVADEEAVRGLMDIERKNAEMIGEVE